MLWSVTVVQLQDWCCRGTKCGQEDSCFSAEIERSWWWNSLYLLGSIVQSKDWPRRFEYYAMWFYC